MADGIEVPLKTPPADAHHEGIRANSHRSTYFKKYSIILQISK